MIQDNNILLWHYYRCDILEKDMIGLHLWYEFMSVEQDIAYFGNVSWDYGNLHIVTGPGIKYCIMLCPGVT